MNIESAFKEIKRPLQPKNDNYIGWNNMFLRASTSMLDVISSFEVKIKQNREYAEPLLLFVHNFRMTLRELLSEHKVLKTSNVQDKNKDIKKIETVFLKVYYLGSLFSVIKYFLKKVQFVKSCITNCQSGGDLEKWIKKLRS